MSKFVIREVATGVKFDLKATNGLEGFAACKHPKFEVYKDKAGEFRFRLKARNGQIIGVSEGYVQKASCLNGIESVKTNAAEE